MSKIKTVGYIAGVGLLTIGTYRFLKKKITEIEKNNNDDDKHFVEDGINDGFIPDRKYIKLADIEAINLENSTNLKVKKIS